MILKLSRLTTATRRVLAVLAAVFALAIAALVTTPSPAHAALLSTTTTLSVSDSDITAGDSVTLTAVVSASGMGGVLVTPSGDVTFTAATASGSTQLGTAPVPAGCVLTLPTPSPCKATLTTTALPVGDVVVTARYAGDALTKPSAGTVDVHVAPVVVPPTLTATDQVGSITLHWVAGSGGGEVDSYTLYRSTTSGGSLTKIAFGLPTGDYQDTTVPTGTTFFYRATTVDQLGVESALSNEASGQAQPLGGGSTFSTTHCPAGQDCASPTISGSSADGSTTSLTAETTASASAHTLTTAVGGPHLVACSDDTPRWLSTTFNDTSSDAYKTIALVVRGPAAHYLTNDSGWRQREIGCLGLGEPWVTAPDGAPARWSPADGLYVGTPFYCKDMSAYNVGGSRYSQPCLVASSHGGVFNPGDPNGSGQDRQFSMVYHLPPGDGRISGSP